MLQFQRFLLPLVFLLSCESPTYEQQAEPQLVGGPCEGCEDIFEFGKRKLHSIDTLPDFNREGQKIKIPGTIFQPDGKTPAPGVILYVYHANQQGVYAASDTTTGWGKRHGDIRAWLKTDEQGRYAFYTLKPGVYPNRTDAAHIHPNILEPDGKYYWLGSYLFEGDTLITEVQRHPESPRGGSNGIVTLQHKNGLWHGTRDVVLGRNVSGYE